MDLRRLAVAGWIAVALGGGLDGARAAEALQFKEVYELLRTNLAGMDEEALNRAAVQGLVKQLGPQVTLLTGTETGTTESTVPRLAKAAVLEGGFAYVRFGRVDAGVEKDFDEAWKKLNATNRLRGLVLDLRFAGGHDYAAAASLADRFFAGETPLLDWGDSSRKSTLKDDAIRMPVALLVNARTAASAEALVTTLQHGNVGLVLGSTTAGLATKFKEFALQNGQRLRIATAEIKFGDGHVLPLTGLKPDIAVASRIEEEQLYLDDAYKVMPKTGRVASVGGTNESSLSGTNRGSRRLNEAELVRMHRDGQSPEEEGSPTPRRAVDSAQPTVQDPVLLRALDLLKGIAVLQPGRK